MFTSLVFNMVIESVTALLLRDECLQSCCQSAGLLYTPDYACVMYSVATRVPKMKAFALRAT